MKTIYQGFTDEEIRTLAQIKRVFERYKGDKEFRNIVHKGQIQNSNFLKGIGVNLDPGELAPVWEQLSEHKVPRFNMKEIEPYPALKLWSKWNGGVGRKMSGFSEASMKSCHPKFSSWRRRQIQRAVSETNILNRDSLFPAFAFELSNGCSMGCWFCGFSAKPLKGFSPYSKENASLWRTILSMGLNFFGEAGKYSVCYYATEPFDNPDYLQFLKDFKDIYGLYPQTTTAAPLKNLALTQELLQKREVSPTIWDRFSILSFKALEQVHEKFSPHELRYVTLIIHNQAGLLTKAKVGKARERSQRLAKANFYANQYKPRVKSPDKNRDEPEAPDTISCICGYLVNLPEKSVKLVTPCPASDQWPEGYRIHARATFKDAGGYRDFLETTADEFMKEKPGWNEMVQFRNNLEYGPGGEGFTLKAKAFCHTLSGKPWFPDLGSMIAKGNKSWGDIVTGFTVKGISPIEVGNVLQNLFDKGLLEENQMNGCNI